MPESEIDRTSLRQGDVLVGIPFPIMDAELAVLGRIDGETGIQSPHPRIVTIPREHRSQNDCFTVQVKARIANCAVVAHCCELELRNGRCLLPMISVARIIPVKASIAGDAARLESLRANKDPRNTQDPGFIDYFYLQPSALLGDIDCVVDLSQIAPVPSSEYPTLLRRKALQLQNTDRIKFKIKLAAFLTRLTDEEAAAGLENPWRSA